MRKFILFLTLILVCGIAWATPDVVLPIEYTKSGQVKSTAGAVYSVQSTYIGATAGDYIQLMDGTGTSASSGPVLFSCVASASSGVCASPYSVPAAYFGTGIFYNQSHAGVFKTYIQSF